MLIYGAEVFAVEGSYDDAFDLSLKEGEKKGWYCRNSAVNPYLLEGKKTCALELTYQTGLNLPDYVFVSVGDGTVYSSFIKGFRDLKELGVIEKIPHVIGVQAEGSAPIKETFEKGEPFEIVDWEQTDTVADSIAVGKPRDYLKACKYASQYGGGFISVSDAEIGQAIMELARKTGVFAEPAGATSFAGFKKMALSGELAKDDSVALIITGNGLKDVKTPYHFLAERVVRVSL
jgi:threonine synthase